MPVKQEAKTLYVKRGNRFVAVGKDDIILPYGIGDYLVRVRRNGKSIRWCKKRLDVTHARIEIALDEAADALARAISKHSEAEPKVVPLTPRERRAMAAYTKIAGKSSLTFNRKSAFDIARLSVIVLRENLRRSDAPPRPEGCLEPLAEREV